MLLVDFLWKVFAFLIEKLYRVVFLLRLFVLLKASRSNRSSSSDETRELVVTGRAWRRFCESLSDAGLVILRNPSFSADDRAEGFRHLTRLIRGGLENYVENYDPYCSSLRPLPYNVKLGADNPDNFYQFANINGSLTYSITGKRNTIHYLSIGAYEGIHPGRSSGEGTGRTSLLSGHEIKQNDQGEVTIILSTDRPDEKTAPSASSNWLKITPLTEKLVVRQTYLCRNAELAADLKLTCLTARPAIPGANPDMFHCSDLQAALAGTALFVNGAADQFCNWTDQFQHRPNTLAELDEKTSASAWADPNLNIFHGYWRLKDASSSALLVIVEPGKGTEFWNFQCDNVYMESLDYERNSNVCLNGRQSQHWPDRPGVFVFLLAAQRPPASLRHINYLDTGFRQHGTFAWRLAYASPKPIVKPRCVHIENLDFDKIEEKVVALV